MCKISVVIPLYNEQDSILELYDRLRKTFERKLVNYDYEIIFVDDGSTDKTLLYLKQCCEKNSRVLIIKFTRNFGQDPAIKAGLFKASGEAIVLMDGDLQNPPEEIPRLVFKLEEGYDIVRGMRSVRGDRKLRKIGGVVYQKMLENVMGIKVFDMGTVFRIFSRKVADVICGMPSETRYPDVEMAWMGFKSVSINVRNDLRKGGESKYSLRKLIKMTIEPMIAFSPKILRQIILLGLVVSGTSFFIGFYYLIRRLLRYQILSGFTTIVVLITFLFGILFILLGLIGEYLAKLYLDSLGRPYYIIDEIISQTQIKKE